MNLRNLRSLRKSKFFFPFFFLGGGGGVVLVKEVAPTEFPCPHYQNDRV